MASRLTEVHRQQQLALRAVTVRELQRFWPALDPLRLDETYPVWERAVTGLVAQQRGISSILARRYLRGIRSEAGVPGDLPDLDVPRVDLPRLQTSLRVTSAVSIKKAMARAVPVERAAATAFVASAGAATRHVMEASRDTVLAAVGADEYAEGWRRVTGGKSCDFCRMLAGRGAVYREATALFASHDHCGCSAEPVYDSTQRRNVSETFTPSARRMTPETRAANNARARAWRSGDGEPGRKATYEPVADTRPDERFVGKILSRTNPNYYRKSDDRRYRFNCTNCVAAFELRMRGEKALSAAPVTDQAVELRGVPIPNFLARWKRPDGGPAKMIGVEGIEDTTTTLLEWGEGSRAFVFIDWKDGRGGHVFSAYVRDGRVAFVDPQIGKRYEPEVFDRFEPGTIRLVRSDDLTLVDADGVFEE